MPLHVMLFGSGAAPSSGGPESNGGGAASIIGGHGDGRTSGQSQIPVLEHLHELIVSVRPPKQSTDTSVNGHSRFGFVHEASRAMPLFGQSGEPPTMAPPQDAQTTKAKGTSQAFFMKLR